MNPTEIFTLKFYQLKRKSLNKKEERESSKGYYGKIEIRQRHFWFSIP